MRGRQLLCRYVRLAAFMPLCAAGSFYAAMCGRQLLCRYARLAPGNRAVWFPGSSCGRGLAPNPECVSVAPQCLLIMPRLQTMNDGGLFPHPCCAAPLPLGEGPGVRAVLGILTPDS